MATIALRNITLAFGRLSLPHASKVCSRGPAASSVCARGISDDRLASIARSPFRKETPTYQRHESYQSKPHKTHHTRPLLLPEKKPEVYIARNLDRLRSFDRKDVGRKPKPLLEVPAIKFAVTEWPKKYTTEPLKTRRTGGRHPVTGRVIYRRIGGGVHRDHLWLDTKRSYIPEDKTIEEKVLEIREDPQRSGFLALVGHDDHQHWITATENMKVGQILKSSREVGRMAIRAFEGDTYAVGALPIGTVLSSLEIRVGSGCKLARAAGCCASIIKKEEGSVIVQLPSKQQVRVSNQCLATVGRVSNPGWKDKNWGKAGATRRRGIRPKSGLWHRKDGYCGRKINPPKPLRDYLLPQEQKITEFAFSALPRRGSRNVAPDGR